MMNQTIPLLLSLLAGLNAPIAAESMRVATLLPFVADVQETAGAWAIHVRHPSNPLRSF